MNENIITELQKLRSEPRINKSKVGKMRDLLPQIEEAQRSGVRLVDIATLLAQQEFEGMNVKCLQNLLYQARKKKVRGGEVGQTKNVMTQQVFAKPQAVNGIDADTILESARKSMKSPTASSLTLDLLRTTK